MNRIEAVRKLLSENEAALIYSPVSRLYLSGFHSSLGYLFITKEQAVLFVDGRYIEAAKSGADKEIEVRLFTNLSEQVKEFLGEGVKSLLVETANTVADVRGFEKLFSKEIICCFNYSRINININFIYININIITKLYSL